MRPASTDPRRSEHQYDLTNHRRPLVSSQMIHHFANFSSYHSKIGMFLADDDAGARGPEKGACATDACLVRLSPVSMIAEEM